MSTRLELRDVSGPLTDLLQKLSGDEGPLWLRAVNRMQRKENPWGISRTFTVETSGASGWVDLQILHDQGYLVDELAEKLICSICTSAPVAPGAYELAVIPGWAVGGNKLFDDDISHHAMMLSSFPLTEQLAAYLAPIVCGMFTADDFRRSGLRALEFMHEPIELNKGELFPVHFGIRQEDDKLRLDLLPANPHTPEIERLEESLEDPDLPPILSGNPPDFGYLFLKPVIRYAKQ